MKREEIKNTKRWVVKIGSALLTNNGLGIDRTFILNLVEQIVSLRECGIEVILVSSGSVAEGMKRLNWGARPSKVHELQAAAAVGQMGLIKAYESKFNKHGIHTAQILLTHDDLSNRQRYLNARSALRSLLQHGVVPVVNENDTVITDEIRFGDNDTLAALVANLVEADVLVILTDQTGLYDKDPRANSDAKLIKLGNAGDLNLEKMSSGGAGKFGTGGMLTKVKAAGRAAKSGSSTVIAFGHEKDVLKRIFVGNNIGTLLVPQCAPLDARKQWLANHMQVCGVVVIDQGAVRVLRSSGKSLLPVGVVSVGGEFRRGDVVSCVDENEIEIARGLVNYSAEDAAKITKKSSDKIESILGFLDEEELIHRDNMVLL